MTRLAIVLVLVVGLPWFLFSPTLATAQMQHSPCTYWDCTAALVCYHGSYEGHYFYDPMLLEYASLRLGSSPIGDPKAPATYGPVVWQNNCTVLDTCCITNVMGAPTDTWGYDLTPAIVNDPTFGVLLTEDDQTSNYTQLGNWGFTIPPAATIDGVVVTLIWATMSWNDETSDRIKTLAIDVYYTEASAPNVRRRVITGETR